MSDHSDGRNRILRFRLGSAWYAIRLEYVSGILDEGPIRDVSGTPRSVLGLIRCRGRLLTVLDLPALLHAPSIKEEVCLIRLNGPNRNTALRIPSKVRLEPLDQDNMRLSRSQRPETEGEIDMEGETVTLLNPEVFISRLETEIRVGAWKG